MFRGRGWCLSARSGLPRAPLRWRCWLGDRLRSSLDLHRRRREAASMRALMGPVLSRGSSVTGDLLGKTAKMGLGLASALLAEESGRFRE